MNVYNTLAIAVCFITYFVDLQVKKECFHPSEVIFTCNTTHPSIVKSSGFRVREQEPEIYMEFAGEDFLSSFTNVVRIVKLQGFS